MMREPLLDDATLEPAPWSTPPSELGSTECEWCYRAIYLPALPCSVRPIAGLADLDTAPGQGQRCKWELVTRAKVPANRLAHPPTDLTR